MKVLTVGDSILRVYLDRTYFAEIENWKYYSKIIYKYVNNAVRPIFNENSEERESLVWFGLGLCGLSRWVNFRVRSVDVFLVLFQVGLKIALGFGCLVLIFWIWVGWFSWFGPKLMGLCLLIGLSFEFVWRCMGLWELSLIDEGVDYWG